MNDAIIQCNSIVGPFVVKYGTKFVSAPLTIDEEQLVRAAMGGERPKMKECFYNAQRLNERARSSVALAHLLRPSLSNRRSHS